MFLRADVRTSVLSSKLRNDDKSVKTLENLYFSAPLAFFLSFLLAHFTLQLHNDISGYTYEVKLSRFRLPELQESQRNLQKQLRILYRLQSTMSPLLQSRR